MSYFDFKMYSQLFWNLEDELNEITAAAETTEFI